MKAFQSLFALALVSLPSVGLAQLAPDPRSIQVRSISYAGSGCKAHTVVGDISPDLKAFTLLFSDFVAEAGPAIPLAESRKNCALNIDLKVPQGWSYSILSVDVRGFLDLERLTQAYERNSYYFQSQMATVSKMSRFVGPYVSDYHVRDLVGIEDVQWSPCGGGRSLIINTEVRVASLSGAARALATVDTLDGNFELIYGLQWRRCH